MEATRSTGRRREPHHRDFTAPTPQRCPSSTRRNHPRLQAHTRAAWGSISPGLASRQSTWSPSSPPCNTPRSCQSCMTHHQIHHRPRTARSRHPYQTSPGFRAPGCADNGPRRPTGLPRNGSRRTPARRRADSRVLDRESRGSQPFSPRCSSARIRTPSRPITPLVPHSTCRHPWDTLLLAPGTTILL